MNLNIQTKWLALFLAVGYVNYFTYDQFFSPKMSGHWSSQEIQKGSNRKPAALDLSKLPALDNFEDFLQYDTHGGVVAYDMDLNFWSDKGEDYFKKNAKSAIEEGFRKTFAELMSNKEAGKKLPNEAKSFIMKEMLNRFVYTIKAVKLIDANFEVDFTFTPRNIEGSYNYELSSNQLVNFNDTGKLLRDVTSIDKDLTDKVSEISIPSNGEAYQYVGGAITISAEILDTNWKITDPIPSPKKNAVKGKLRLRKYIRVNNPSIIDFSSIINDKNIIVDMTHLRTEEGFKTPYMTVDTIYAFNLEELIPTPEVVEINFGELVALNKTHDNIIKRIFSIFKKDQDVDTATLYIKGEHRLPTMNQKFRTKIKTLVYDIKEKKFSNQSKIFTYAANSSSNFQLNQMMKKALLENNSQEIIDALRLEKVLKVK